MAAVPAEHRVGSERRNAERTRTLKRATIVFNNRFSTYDCVVRNLSATGALILLDDSFQLPNAFELKIGEEAPRAAGFVHRRGPLVGIRFLDVSAKDDTMAGQAHEAIAPLMNVGSIQSPATATADNTSVNVGAIDGGRISRIVSEPLPLAVLRNLRWN